jgi:large subunit ribosomal protein L23
VNKSNNAYLWIRESHITEKSTNLANANKYVFKVSDFSNKKEIKKTIESFYNVSVMGVNVINMPGKKRRLGRHEGYKKGFRKAIITLKEGDKIEILAH